MRKVHFATLGCKTNQYETQAMREKFLKAGFIETSDPKDADLFVVNTCTVTGDGDRKSRSVIRRFHRNNPAASIAVTGCYATLNRSEILKLPGVDFVVPNQQKDHIVDHLSLETKGRFCGEGDESTGNRYTDLSISYFADHARAFVKIQDGCDHACTYCKVVLVRGSSRSRNLEDVIEEAQRLRDAGYKELVLTGIQLGAYGDEWGNGKNLVSILEKLTEISGLVRIRLSSIDPSDVTEELIELMKSRPQICRHLHLPLQSGDDEILKKMRRAYRKDRYLQIVKRLKDVMPEFSLTTDVMVGFPGEEEKHFQNTVDLLRQVLPLKAHIFPFSPREGTRAAQFEDQVDQGLIRERVARLQEVCEDMAQKCQRVFIGRVGEVLVENSEQPDMAEGHTSNYLKVRFQKGSLKRGDLVSVCLDELRADYFLGRIVTN